MTANKPNPIDFSAIEAMMHRAAVDRVFPGAVLLVQKGRTPLYHHPFGITNFHTKVPVTVDTVYDLASLTKPLATTLALLLLVQEGRLALDQTLGSLLPVLNGTGKEGIEIRHLMLHTSGLPAHRPYYKQLLSLPYDNRRERLNGFLVSEPLTREIGEAAVYSDIGFMFLRWIIETVSGMRLDRFVSRKIYKPLNVAPLYFIPLGAQKDGEVFAATQWCSWRNCFPVGVVADENAFASDGVDGHAGLFGTAASVGALVGELMAVYRGEPHAGLFQNEWVRRFFKRDEASGRSLGFDTPTPGGSSSGAFFSEETVGHLGYTGVSFWADLKTDISIVLLTNRVHPDAGNDAIRAFRPELHNAVMACVLPGAEDE
jgi:CubicO group peptidase (beta-lactamase class C family)